MKRPRLAPFAIPILLALAACGPTAMEVKTAADAADAAAATAAATAAAATAAATAAAKLNAAAADAVTKAKANAAAAAAKLNADAEAQATGLLAEAARLEADIPAIQAAVAAARIKATAAAPALEKLAAQAATCNATAQAVEERAAAARSTKAAQLEGTAVACKERAGQANLDCSDTCSSTATKCERTNWDRPNARDRCGTTKSECQAQCGNVAEQSCEGAFAQARDAADLTRNPPVPVDPCLALDAKVAAAKEPSQTADTLVTSLNADMAKVATKKQQAERIVSDAKQQAEIIAKCGLGSNFIPAGTFTMGDDQNSGKAGSVTVAAFCMDTTEVTTQAYTACVTSGKCTPADTGGSNNSGIAGRENHPINGVDWNQATAYCEAQGQRLPTEEEWEYAARGTDGRKFPWGNTEPAAQLCWDGEGNDLGKGNRPSTCAAGSYPKGNSPFGLADMAGNVWEWTSSKYSASDTGSNAARVNRGGSWSTVNPWRPLRVRSALRNRNGPSLRRDNLGFRCAGLFSLDP